VAKLIIGCGYLGRVVADLWLAAGDTVYATTRSAQHADELSQSGIKPVICDITRPASLTALPEVSTVLMAVGFDRSSGKTIDEVYVQGLKNVLHALSKPEPDATTLSQTTPSRFIYISSTGVYAQDDGSWVDEQAACNPVRPGGKACLMAEKCIAESVFAAHSIILRLAGIYGPKRLPRLQDLKAGNPLPAPSQGYLNLIHVADAAQIVNQVTCMQMDGRSSPQVYNVCDGSPVLRHEYYQEVARQADTPPPSFTEPPAGSPAAARAGSDKRISNAKLVRELNPKLQYPSYREGIAAILKHT